MPVTASTCRITLPRFAPWCVGGALLLSGCQGFSNPWAYKPSATAEDLAKYGPTAAQRIEELQQLQTAGIGTDPTVHESKSAELARKIQTEQDPHVRAQIMRTIGPYPTRIAAAVLHGGTSDPAPIVRIACAEGWGKRNDVEALEHLQKLYKADENQDVRQAAVKALANLKQPEAIKLVGGALEDPDPAMQFLAMNSLRTQTGRDLGNDVAQWRAYLQQGPEPRPQESLVNSWFNWWR